MIRRIIPSMFHRRLTLLGLVSLSLIVAMGVQIFRLTVVQGAMWRQRAESALTHTRLIPTSRGPILDRRLRVLAVQAPSDEVAVHYTVITGKWAYTRARMAAWRAYRNRWGELTYEQHEQLIEAHRGPFDAQVDHLWQVLCQAEGIDADELQHRRDTVVRRVQRIASDVWRRSYESRLAAHEDVEWEDVVLPVAEQDDTHPLVNGVAEDLLLDIRRQIAEAGDDADNVWSRVQIKPSRRRDYPLETMTVLVDRDTMPGPLRSSQPAEVTVDGVGIHMLGDLRSVWQEDVQRRPYRLEVDGQDRIDLGGYLPGDRVGAFGIEKAREDALRGLRGRAIEYRDTQARERLEPVPGSDVVLSVDIQLQARIQAVMDPSLGLMRAQPWHAKEPTVPLGTPLNGAAVVLDVSTSQVLAAVSVPGFSRRQLREDSASVWNDRVNQPWLNRAIARPYASGSTVKPMVLAAAVTDGKVGPGQVIVCNGHLDPDAPNRYRCWIYKHYNGATHGPLTGPEAIQHSCNIFFYTLGRRLGAARLVWWYEQFGLGHKCGCGLNEEIAGFLPDLATANHPNAVGFSAADAIFMGIGQGRMNWTVLQAAGAYATLARGGYYMSPTFFLVPGRDDAAPRGYDLRLDPRGVQMALDGLDRAVNQRGGTAHHIAMLGGEPVFNIDGVRILGKSGTASAAPFWIDEDGDGAMDESEIKRHGDHAWFVGLVQRPGSPRPDYVVAVVVEYAGSGGAVAGPIANQILHAMRAEGYL